MNYLGIFMGLLLTVALQGCETTCRAECERAAEELRTVFAIEAPCTEPEWDEATSCEECDRLLAELYSVLPDVPLCDR